MSVSIYVQLIKFKIPVAGCKCDFDFIQNYWKWLKSTHKYLTIGQQVVPTWNCVANIKTSSEILTFKKLLQVCQQAIN